MKKAVAISFLFMLSLYNAQLIKRNFLIMVDEAPCYIVANLELTSQSIKPINPNYIVGTIDFSENNYAKLLIDKSESFDLSFETILPNKSFPLKYSINIPKSFLNQDYIIINIFNMDNKKYKRKYSKLIKDKKEYYVVIKTPSAMKFD